MILKMNDLWDLVNTNIQVPSNPNFTVKHNLKDMKSRCMILDGVRDHINPHITRKDIECQMWVALTSFH